jgi:hypothetical protein
VLLADELGSERDMAKTVTRRQEQAQEVLRSCPDQAVASDVDDEGFVVVLGGQREHHYQARMPLDEAVAWAARHSPEGLAARRGRLDGRVGPRGGQETRGDHR